MLWVLLMSTPTTTIDLSQDAEALGTTGHTVAIILPDGTVLDLWVYDHPSTTSVDVRYRPDVEAVNGIVIKPVVRSIDINGTVAVVLR